MTEEVKKTRKPNSWIAHLKKYSAEHGIAYAAAISDPRCRELYLNSKETPELVPAEPVSPVPESQPAPVVEEPLVEKPKKKRKRKKVVKSEE